MGRLYQHWRTWPLFTAIDAPVPIWLALRISRIRSKLVALNAPHVGMRHTYKAFRSSPGLQWICQVHGSSGWAQVQYTPHIGLSKVQRLLAVPTFMDLLWLRSRTYQLIYPKMATCQD
jgi:hypothetical protein